MNLYWYPEPSTSERAEVEAWIEANDCWDLVVLGIGPTTVVAFGTNNATRGWGTTEVRRYHADLSSALTAILARLRGRQADPEKMNAQDD